VLHETGLKRGHEGEEIASIGRQRAAPGGAGAGGDDEDAVAIVGRFPKETFEGRPRGGRADAPEVDVVEYEQERRSRGRRRPDIRDDRRGSRGKGRARSVERARPSHDLEGHHLADLAVFLDREVVTRQARNRVAFRVHDHGIDRDQVYPGGEAGSGRGGWGRLRFVGGGADRP